MRQDSDGRFWLIFLFFGAKESPGRKLEDKRQLEGEKKERKYITTREKKGKERKGTRCSDGACVAFVACTREGASLLSFLFFPRAPQSTPLTLIRHLSPVARCNAPVPSRPVPFRPTPLVRRYIPQSRIGLAILPLSSVGTFHNPESAWPLIVSNTSFRGGEVP